MLNGWLHRYMHEWKTGGLFEDVTIEAEASLSRADRSAARSTAQASSGLSGQQLEARARAAEWEG